MNDRTMQITPIQTDIYRPDAELIQFLIQSLKNIEIQEKSILVITSKIVSLSEHCLVPSDKIQKSDLIILEADHDLGEVAYGCRLTIKHGLFIPSAGIDESNSENGDYILFPKDPFASAQRIQAALAEHFNLKSFGVLITDSHTLPLRQGVVGIALSYWGFLGVKNIIGQKDLFGRPLQMTKMDCADGLASAAVFMMGEGAESTPLALIQNAPVDFSNQIDKNEIKMPIQEDLYFPLYRDRLKDPS